MAAAFHDRMKLKRNQALTRAVLERLPFEIRAHRSKPSSRKDGAAARGAGAANFPKDCAQASMRSLGKKECCSAPATQS